MKRASLMIAGLTLAMATGFGIKTAAHDHELCQGFVPENTMKIPVGWKAKFGQKAKGGLSEAQFNEVLDRVDKIFSPIVQQEGGRLQINRKWTDPTVNASAQQFGTTWVINMYGGLARHPEVTMEGFALVACHELGHHIGGAPKIKGWFGDDWATNEGGSDYYATLKCLRKYFAEDDNKSILATAELQPIAQQRCTEQFTNETDQLLCMRNSLAGESVAGLFMDLRKQTTRPKYDTPDTREVTKTNDNHPDTQCRMDTYFAGAICNVDVSVPLSKTDYREGSCATPQHTLGFRPRCWFKPTENIGSSEEESGGVYDDYYNNRGSNIMY